MLTDTGEVEMDALIMDGASLACGAVAAVDCVRHPVELARAVMENTEHTLLVAHGAWQLADREKMEKVWSEIEICPHDLLHVSRLVRTTW